MNKNEVKKELYKTKEMADFSHYISGNLYYNVKVGFDVFQFPIPTVEAHSSVSDLIDEPEGDESMDGNFYTLSEDLGTTTFSDKMRGSHLIRWIDKAIDSGEFVMIEVAISPI